MSGCRRKIIQAQNSRQEEEGERKDGSWREKKENEDFIIRSGVKREEIRTKKPEIKPTLGVKRQGGDSQSRPRGEYHPNTVALLLRRSKK